jgi:hypothetical protein
VAGVLWATTNAAGAATWRGAYVTRLRCSALAVPNVRHAEHLLLNGSVAERSLTVDPLKPRLRDARNRAVPVDFEWTQFPLGTKRSPGRVRVQTPKSFRLQERFEPQAEGGEVAQPCCCCDRPATHHFAVSYRGQVLRGAICEEHGNAVARERLGLHDDRRNLGNTKIGRALTDPKTTPYFRRIAEPEHQEIVRETRGSRFDLFPENRFSPRRRRSMSRSRYSVSRGSKGKRDGAGRDAIDIELVMVPDTGHQSRATHKAGEVRIPDTSLIIDPQIGNGGSLTPHPRG